MAYRSRFRVPDPSRGPDPARFPLERDLRVFKRLDIRRYSTSRNLHHFIGGDYARFDHRLGQLYDGGYVGRIKEHLHPDTVHARHLVYYLTDKARAVLMEHGRQVTFGSTKQYLHECLTSFIYDSIEIGATDAGIEFIGWDKLQHDERVPARHEKHPFAIELKKGHLRLDGTPAVLRRGERALCIPGVEVDRNTEPLRSYHLREKWTDKISAISEFMKSRLYNSHFGFPNAVIPIYSTNRTHLFNLMALTKEMIGTPTWLIFQSVEDWPKAKHFPAPNGLMFTEPYLRIDQPPFLLTTLGDS